ncbi:MAG: signal recognition particle-docking protein FtsY [Cytophagales bacterium]|nr:signal recognition particle-docking protein FtsY [Cytophagales bacterium]
MGLFDFLRKPKPENTEVLSKGLEKTRQSFFSQLTRVVFGKSSIDEQVLDQLEEMLIASDVGVNTTLKIIEKIQKKATKDKYLGVGELDQILKNEIRSLLHENKAQDIQSMIPHHITTPYIIMVVGVNGVGKTTTIGKLAAQFHQAGLNVVLGAGDTFRAAAVQQLKMWGERAGVPVVDHGMNTDPASVAYDAVKKGMDTKADVVIIDTAGRLHNKVNLMNELTKIRNVMQKVHPDAPHEVLLVLDGSTGQNAYMQAQEFTKATHVTALAITKLDGTAKGGVVIGISDQLNIPVKYIGVGEKINDLQLFDRDTFVDSLFGKVS